MLATTLHSATWGFYYSFTRWYLIEELRAGADIVMTLTGLEWAFVGLSPLSSYLGKTLGERGLIGIASLTAIPLFTGFIVKDPSLLILLLSAGMMPWSLGWPAVLSSYMNNVRGTLGKEYGYMTSLTGVGYCAGALLSNVVYTRLGSFASFIVVGALYLATFALFYLYYPGGSQPTRQKARTGTETLTLRYLAVFTASFALAVATRETLYSRAPVKIIHVVKELSGEENAQMLYTIVYSVIPAVLSVPVRILAGRLVDSAGPLRLYLSTVIGYGIIYFAMMYSGSYIALIVWTIPLYPFLDTAVTTLLAAKSRENEMTKSMSINILASAIGGLIVALLPHVNIRYGGIDVLIAVFVALSAVTGIYLRS